MEYVYAALLLHKLKKPINEESVKKVIQASGVTPDEVKIKSLISALSEIDIDEALKSAAFAPAMVAPASATGGVTPAAEAKKEEAKPKEKGEKKEEEALEGLSSLFG